MSNVAKLEASFRGDVNGGTPLGARVREALHDKGFTLADEPPRAAAAPPTKRLLLLIATDGEPDEGPSAFVDTLAALPENVYVQLLAVTDDAEAVKWMNDADDKVRFLDVCDDYTEESGEVEKAQGPGFSFTHADYLVKIMLGAIDPYFDLLDETKLPAGLYPLPYPSFKPFVKGHYRSRGADSPRAGGGGGGF